MKKLFIHISDLHIAEKKRPGLDNVNPRTEKTYLVAQNDEDNKCYIGEFCDYLNEKYKESDTEFYLLISGDIADSSSKEEYDYAKRFLEKILEKLRIDKSRVLIVPGNHDVSWDKCKEAARKAKEDGGTLKNAYEYLEEKYYYFKLFYDDFYDTNGKRFDPRKQVVDSLILEDERLLFVGINTNYKIDYSGGKGAVEIELLSKELTALCDSNTDYSKVAFCHHNISSDSDEDNSPYGSWDKNGWISFKRLLEEKDFKFAMFGNEHIRASSRRLNMNQGDNAMYLSDSGSFALHDEGCVPSFKVYELYHDNDRTTLKQSLFELGDVGRTGVRDYGKWCMQINNEHDELEEYVLRENNPNSFDQNVIEDPVNSSTSANCLGTLSEDIEDTETVPTEHFELEALADSDFHDEMMNIIKSEHLYHPGHFHWGKSSRSHNWIDTISLLNDRRYIGMIQKKIRMVVGEIEKAENLKYDVIIGLGMEGNIMSTQLLLDNTPYTYLPYTYRYDDYNEFEKRICIENGQGMYKNVLIVTDVVNRGWTLKNLIEEKDNNSAFFSEVEQINIISLFYTGNYKERYMPVGLKEIKDKIIKFYSLMQLEAGECPYGDDFENTCTIYKEHLCEVYKFYSEK